MTVRAAVVTVALSGTLLIPAVASAGGFEVGSNTALSNARGGTGIASRSDASATTINPGRLAFAKGFQVVGGANLVDLNLRFQRDPLVRPIDVQEFDEVKNQSPPFPVPYIALSWEVLENLTLGISGSGPHAYGARCFTEIVDGECVVDFENAARHMIVETDLIQIYAMASVAYAVEFDVGTLGFGLSGGPAFQQSNLTLVVDQASLNVGPPYTENPDAQASFSGVNLRDIKPAFVGGVAWEGANGLRLAVAYQPGIKWEANGKVDLELPDSIRDLVELTNDDLVLRTNQAHRLSAGVGHALGEHPGVAGAPLFDVELNVVWEDWSRVQAFESAPAGSLLALETEEIPINPVLQPKGYEDTFAIRIGGTYAASDWLSVHAGGFVETAAQREAVTNADFVSWERYSGSAGLTFHTLGWLDITASYAYVGSPSRQVEEGSVYSQVPLSQCKYPGYDQPQCAKPGVPPGNPQNEGEWHAHFHIAGLTLGGRF